MVRDLIIPPWPLGSFDKKLVTETIELLERLDNMACKCEYCDGMGRDSSYLGEVCRGCGGVGEIIRSAACELGDIRSILKRWGRKEFMGSYLKEEKD